MCGFFLHGFNWKLAEIENEDFVVVFDLEINSHSAITEYRQIPVNAQRIGIDPINGIPVTNDENLLPQRVIEKASLFFEAYYPNKEAIAQWIKNNYRKQNDRKEWDINLLNMLCDKGKGLFSKKYYQKRIEYYQKGIEDYQKGIEDYQKGIKNLRKLSNDCTGSLDEMDINQFITYFLDHPNDYWAERIEERKVEYKSFVEV